MNYDFTKEAKIQFEREFDKISAIENMEGLDGDIQEAAVSIISILKNEEVKIKKSFYDYLSRYLFTKHMIDVSDFVGFAINKQDERKSVNGKRDLLTKQRLENCLSNQSFIPQKRDFVFRLAFVLGMNDEECQELLKKGMNERGFNFKNPVEFIYWYCLKFGYGFIKASELFEKYEAIVAEAPNDEDANTEDVYIDFTNKFAKAKLTDSNDLENVLMECLTEIKSKYFFKIIDDDLFNNRLNLMFNVEDARGDGIINKIRKEIYEINNASENEYSKEKFNHRSNLGLTSLYDVSKYLYRSYYDDTGKEVYIADIKETVFDLPDDIRNNRLTRERLSNIVMKEDKTQDKYPNRQDLITSVFLLYELNRKKLMDEHISELEDDEMKFDAMTRSEKRDDFCEKVNKKLNLCGLLDINANNLYEYFIMLCMSTDDPLGTFQEVYIQSIKKG